MFWTNVYLFISSNNNSFIKWPEAEIRARVQPKDLSSTTPKRRSKRKLDSETQSDSEPKSKARLTGKAESASKPKPKAKPKSKVKREQKSVPKPKEIPHAPEMSKKRGRPRKVPSYQSLCLFFIFISRFVLVFHSLLLIVIIWK